MKRTLFIVAAVVGFASAASAFSLTVASDKLTYNVGETITITVTGDSDNVKSTFLFGALNYSAALTTFVQNSQTRHTRGTLKMTTGTLASADGSSSVFNQIWGDAVARSVDQLQIATVQLLADGVGIVDVTWGATLNYFGATKATFPGTVASFEIIPEPATAALLGLGVLGLVLGGRRRKG
jgi:hypothetical protein